MNTPHPYAEILRAIADGKEVQWKMPTNVGGGWADQSWDDTLNEILDESWTPECYRVKPDVVVINGREVPAPLRKMPLDGALVFWPELQQHALVGDGTTSRHPLYENLWRRGLLHVTREAARAHAEALLSFTKQP